MKAVTIIPRKANSLRLREIDVPNPKQNDVLLRVLRVGICGTDRDIISGFYGEPPKGSEFLVLGHESLCRVADVGRSVTGFNKGQLAVPTVRISCTENCINCRNGESDMCLTGHYREHGIRGLHGFASEYAISDSQFVTAIPEDLSQVGVLLEPLTVVEKGLSQTFLIQSKRMKWEPQRVLVLGAGPVGILAAAILRLRDLEVDAVATRSEESLKATLVRKTGSQYINAKTTPINALTKKYDIVFEITGSPTVAMESHELVGVNGVLCYLGIYREQIGTEDIGKMFTDLVLGNRVHFGSVNANRGYFEQGARDLVSIKKEWPGLLESMITRKADFEDLDKAYKPENEEEIKTIIEVS